MSDASNTISGMRPVEGADPTAGHRDYSIELVCDHPDSPIEIEEMFNEHCQTFDPTDAVEFTTPDSKELHRFRVGDVIKMRVVINT